jgi:hypothetical protein
MIDEVRRGLFLAIAHDWRADGGSSKVLQRTGLN